MIMPNAEDWKYTAIDRQRYFNETLGSRSYDEINKSNIFHLKKMVGFATCGNPRELPASSNYYTGYRQEELQDIKSICTKIIEKSDQDPIQFACVKLIVHHNGAIGEYPVFRINTKSGKLFIDPNCRVYVSWERFMNENKLPECEYCYPLNGEYNVEGQLHVSFASSPASYVMSKTANYLDTVGSVASIAVASVSATGLFLTVAPVVATIAGATAVCTGVYGMSRSLHSLYDRNNHDQSIGLSDRESRSAWMSIGSSAVGVSTLAALGKARDIVDSGESLTNVSVIGLHALNTSSFAFSGFGFVDSVTTYVEKYNQGVLTRQDVFDLSCELLFLFNAAASVSATTSLVNTMSNAAVGLSPAQRAKMTKSQKRNFRRRAARRRAKGLAAPVTEESKEAFILPAIGPCTPLQALILEAVTDYVPRIEEITFTCHSISHDIICWKNNEISENTLFSNLYTNLSSLYDRYLIDTEEILRKVETFLSFSTNKDIKSKVYNVFENCSNENRRAFSLKVLGMDDKVNVLLNNAEKDISDLKHRLEIETYEITTQEDVVDNTEDSYESVLEESEYNDDSGLNPETQLLLARCADVIEILDPTCSTLQSLGYILDAVKYVVTDEFKARMSIYKISLETTKSTLGSSFDIVSFHKTLNISDEIDVVSFMFNQTLKDLTSRNTLIKLTSKYNEVEYNMNPWITALWDGIIDGTFHFRVNNERGFIMESDLLSVASSIVGNAITEQNSTMVENIGVTVVKVMDETDTHVVCWEIGGSCGSGIIMIVK